MKGRRVKIIVLETVLARVKIKGNIIFLHGGNPGPRKEKDKTT